jgi:16S rRNA (adenine1518-N6/adenine1519-N6)-dimethyltransferase
MIVKQTKAILNKYQMYAKKMYGQNFLINSNVLDVIVKNSDINKETCVIEIGPGIGSLTEMLALNAKKVLAYEIDSDMVTILQDTLASYDNVIIENVDILKANINDDIKKYFNGDEVIIVANLPYYITTPIIFKLLEETEIKKFLFMVQKEVGKRLTGKPKTKDYNALSVLMEYKTRSKIIYNVPRNSFFPEPNVDSVLIKIEAIKNDYTLNNEANFVKFIQACFLQRRKTLVNNLAEAYQMAKDDIIKTLVNQSFNEMIRAEELSLDDIVTIYKTLFE